MKRILATAAVCAALAGVLTGCSGTNYSYDTRDVYRDGMAYDGYYNGMTTDGYYDGRNSTIDGVTKNDADGRGTRDTNDRSTKRDAMDGNTGSRGKSGKTTTPRSNTTVE